MGMTQSNDPVDDGDAPIEPSDELVYDAYVWLVRMTSGEATEDEMTEFLRWRDASDENLVAISKATMLWNALGGLQDKDPASEDFEDAAETPVSPLSNATLQ
ncbi:hypothetical protein D3C71_154340 [compost metagenome]